MGWRQIVYPSLVAFVAILLAGSVPLHPWGQAIVVSLAVGLSVYFHKILGVKRGR